MKNTSSLCQFLEIHAIRMPFNICKEGCWFSGRFVTLLITWWRWYLICVKIRKFAPTWRHRFWHAQNSPKFENEGLFKISTQEKPEILAKWSKGDENDKNVAINLTAVYLHTGFRLLLGQRKCPLCIFLASYLYFLGSPF